MVEEKIETIAFSKTCLSYLYETLNAQKLILNLGQNTLVGISIKYRFFAEVLLKKVEIYTARQILKKVTILKKDEISVV